MAHLADIIKRNIQRMTSKPSTLAQLEEGDSPQLTEAEALSYSDVFTGKFVGTAPLCVEGLRDRLIADQAASGVVSALMIATNTNILMNCDEDFVDNNFQDDNDNALSAAELAVIFFGMSIMLFMLSILTATIIGHILNATETDEQANRLVAKSDLRGDILRLPYKLYLAGFACTFIALFAWLYCSYDHYSAILWIFLGIAVITFMSLCWLGRSFAVLISDLRQVIPHNRG
jgi:hypothetical protein